MPEQTNGVALARSYWFEVVRPILDSRRPRMPRAAARVGTGSDVLGLDDEMSRDHDWGLRLQLFVPQEWRRDIERLLADRLPDTYRGLPTALTYSGATEPVCAVEILTVGAFAGDRLGFDPRWGATLTDWLSLTGQAALEVTAGEVFEDSAGEFTWLREALAWYPDDVWRHLVACDWHRIDQELPLLGRAGLRGDDLGSRVIAGRLVGVAMHLGFLLTRRWAPYPKWRGTAFASLPLPAEVGASLAAVLREEHWQSRGELLAEALQGLAQVQAEAGLPSCEPACVPFWDRPFLQVNRSMTERLLEGVRDPEVRALPLGLGGAEQRTDNVDVLVHPARRRALVQDGASLLAGL